jgi:N-methylhydantoinase A
MDAVGRVLQPVADALGVEPVEAARGIVRVANNNMVNALKLVSVNRGHDPRDFSLVAFGGGGGMHAVALAAELGIRKVVVPRAAEVFSAWGMLMSDLRRDYFVTRLIPMGDQSTARLEELLAEVTGSALARFDAEGVPQERVSFLRYGNLRYENQEHAVEVLLPDGAVDVAEVLDRFHDAYEREYTYRLTAGVELIGVHVVAVADVGKLEPAPLPANGATVEEALKGRRSVDYGLEGIHDAAIYEGELLPPGGRFSGPAIVESRGSTVVVHPGNEVAVDAYGSLVIEVD